MPAPSPASRALPAMAPAMERAPRARTRILGLGTSLPPFSAPQETVARFFRRVFLELAPSRRRDRAIEIVERVAATSGVEARHGVVSDYGLEDPSAFRFYPPRWDLEPFPTTAARMAVYERESLVLAEEAARRALGRARVPPSAVTHLVVCTCTGFFAPGPDILLLERLGMGPSVERTIVGFMGCHAGFTGLRVVDAIVGSDPDAVVLQISVELCSLHFQKRPAPEVVIANLIFADGCAAALYGSTAQFAGDGIADILATASRVGADSLDGMSWRIGDTGFEMRLDPSVPATLGEEAPDFLGGLLEKVGIGQGEVGSWALHPGGRKILDVLAERLDLDDGATVSSREVLRSFGNMSSATIFFVLEHVLQNGGKSGPLVALGFGPGLTLEGAVLAPSTASGGGSV